VASVKAVRYWPRWNAPKTRSIFGSSAVSPASFGADAGGVAGFLGSAGAGFAGAALAGAGGVAAGFGAGRAGGCAFGGAGDCRPGGVREIWACAPTAGSAQQAKAVAQPIAADLY